MEIIHEPYAVYKNMEEWSNRRKLKIINWNYEILSSGESSKTPNILPIADFKKSMGVRRYIAMKLEDLPERKRRKNIKVTTITIIFEAGNFDKTQQFKTLIEKLKPRDNILLDVYVFSKDDISIHIKNAIEGLTRKDLRITPSRYDKLLLVVPMHVNSPIINVLSQEEEKKFLEESKISKSALQTTFINDPGVFWTSAEIGDIVVEVHISETVGYEYIYKLVVNQPVN